MTEPFEPTEILNKIILCTLVVDEITNEFEVTSDPDQRADLLLAVEQLGGDVAELVFKVRDAVWNTPTK
jgi:hypothetical protein